jgi:hypothetical protein
MDVPALSSASPSYDACMAPAEAVCDRSLAGIFYRPNLAPGDLQDAEIDDGHDEKRTEVSADGHQQRVRPIDFE